MGFDDLKGLSFALGVEPQHFCGVGVVEHVREVLRVGAQLLLAGLLALRVGGAAPLGGDEGAIVPFVDADHVLQETDVAEPHTS